MSQLSNVYALIRSLENRFRAILTGVQTAVSMLGELNQRIKDIERVLMPQNTSPVVNIKLIYKGQSGMPVKQQIEFENLPAPTASDIASVDLTIQAGGVVLFSGNVLGVTKVDKGNDGNPILVEAGTTLTLSCTQTDHAGNKSDPASTESITVVDNFAGPSPTLGITAKSVGQVDTP
jgi:hypothetical protein